MNRRNFIKITIPLLATNNLLASESATQNPQLTFGVIADPQYADAKTKGTRFYKNSLTKLTNAISELNKHPLQFTVTLGDVIDRDLKSFDAILPIYKTAKSPQTFILGNHDFDVADEDKSKVLPKLGLEKSYYSQTHGDWHFIYLDGNDVSIYRHPQNSPQTKAAKKKHSTLKSKPNSKGCGSIGKDQMQWLTEELDNATKSNKRIIVFNHFPVIPIQNNHNIWNAHEIVELLTSHKNVVAYMNGHNHKGNYTIHKGCHFINIKGMVEGETTTPYAIVKCFADRIEINGFDTEPDRNLPARLG